MHSRKPKRPKRIEQTISEKILKVLEVMGSPQALASRANTDLPAFSDLASEDYSQAVYLKKMNYYFNTVWRKNLRSGGYSQGITLLWLTMISWGLEGLFYEMIRIMTDCPFDQLSQIGYIMRLFFNLIDVGQNPSDYSNQDCTQDDIDEIIGEASRIFTMKKMLTQEDLEKRLKRFPKENTMMIITGCWQNKKTGESEGHTVGVFRRGEQYYLFDPSSKSLPALEYSAEEPFIQTLWQFIFPHVKMKYGEVSLQVLHRHQPLPLQLAKVESRSKQQAKPLLEPTPALKPLAVPKPAVQKFSLSPQTLIKSGPTLFSTSADSNETIIETSKHKNLGYKRS